jgi:L-lactate utilization protein LutB
VRSITEVKMSYIRQWHMMTAVQRSLEALEKNGFTTLYASTKEQASREILRLIPADAVVGVGGSVTVRELGLVDALIARGNTVAQHWGTDLTPEERMDARRRQLTSDVFLTSSNAITEGGQLVNVDGGGQRVAAMIFGPKRVIVVAGVNKIVKDVDAAVRRIKEVAAPMNAKRLNRKTPCAETGVCSDCESPERICSVTTIFDRRPSLTDVTVVIVGEELGY